MNPWVTVISVDNLLGSPSILRVGEAVIEVPPFAIFSLKIDMSIIA